MSSATHNTDQNRWTRHCAVVSCSGVLAGQGQSPGLRRGWPAGAGFREVLPDGHAKFSGLPPFGKRERVEDAAPAAQMRGRQAGEQSR
jgi:hypothetical protein